MRRPGVRDYFGQLSQRARPFFIVAEWPRVANPPLCRFHCSRISGHLSVIGEDAHGQQYANRGYFGYPAPFSCQKCRVLICKRPKRRSAYSECSLARGSQRFLGRWSAYPDINLLLRSVPNEVQTDTPQYTYEPQSRRSEEKRESLSRLHSVHNMAASL